MQLIQPLESHLLEMMNWFLTEKELMDWSGPNFRYPFNKSSFIEDIKLDTLNSFSLVSKKSELLAFGQYYQRLNRCHLGRLVVNPEYRGQGIAFELMRRICEVGLKELKVEECSLFVLSHNESAIKAYTKFGFRLDNYPDEISIKNCLYMVKG
jgi:ribosomal protein S18 acetylase RimI-like enzyme